MKKKMRIDVEIKTKNVQSQNFMHPVLPTARDVFCSLLLLKWKKVRIDMEIKTKNYHLEGLLDHV